ncbi:hypothetical protein K438DRAFT_1599270, partial [Mycena galopus ATCC 62051]
MLKAASLAETDPRKRAHWVSLALHGLSQHVVKASSVDEKAKTNLMIQNLRVNQRDPPALHKPLVRCLNKYGTGFAAIQPSTSILRDMPLWHHPGEDPRKRQENNGKKAKCLRGNHNALKIGDGLDLAQRLNNPLHDPRASCMCDECDDDRTIGTCTNPHACVTAAASRLGQILPKWIPQGREEDLATAPPSSEDESGVFVAPKGIVSLAQGLRVMTHRASEPKERVNPRARRRDAVTPLPIAVTVYISGAVHAPPRRKAYAAAGVIVDDEGNRNSGRCIPADGEQSQHAAEIFAALEAT